MTRPILALAAGLVVFLVILQVINVVALRTAWPHLTAMCGGLIGASVSFLRLIQSLLSGGSLNGRIDR